MADSDNTTTLPFVTRRQVLAGTATAPMALTLERSALAGDFTTTDTPPDPALVLWREWEAAHRLTDLLCRRQQHLEKRLMRTIGFPCVTVRLPEGEDVTLHSVAALHEVLSNRPDTVAQREEAEAEFAAHQARWDAAAEETGYTAALEVEREAGDRTEDLLEALSAIPATTLAGVAGKLDAVLREGKDWEELAEFPWAQIRSALTDLVRIGRQIAPGQSFPGEPSRKLRTRPAAAEREDGSEV